MVEEDVARALATQMSYDGIVAEIAQVGLEELELVAAVVEVVDWPEVSSFKNKDNVYGLAVKWSGAVRVAELNERMLVATTSEVPTA